MPAPAPAKKPAPAPAKASAPAKPLAPKVEPRHGIRRLRVRGKLADGRQFLSSSAFLIPADPDEPEKG